MAWPPHDPQIAAWYSRGPPTMRARLAIARHDGQRCGSFWSPLLAKNVCSPAENVNVCEQSRHVRKRSSYISCSPPSTKPPTGGTDPRSSAARVGRTLRHIALEGAGDSSGPVGENRRSVKHRQRRISDVPGAPRANLAPLVVVVLGFIALWLLLVLVLWVHRPTRDLAMPLLRLVPDLARMVRGILRDPATPRSVKVAIGFLLIWLISPIDVIPEFLPVIGPLDDVVVAILILRWSAKRIGRDRLESHWTGTPEGWHLIQRVL